MTSTFLQAPLKSLGASGFLALLAWWVMSLSPPALAGEFPVQATTEIAPAASSASTAEAVLEKARVAARKMTYVGTFVVMSAEGTMASSRIWHLSSGDLQVERMESLTGSPRMVFRRNDLITTYLPELRLARSEHRDSFGLFPHLPRVNAADIGRFYRLNAAGGERVAGLDTDIFHLVPRDGLRYGYRLWVERRTGFAVQLQTLDGKGRMLEQAAFSDLKFDEPLRAARMQHDVIDTSGWKLEKIEHIRTSPRNEGWAMHEVVPGFQPMDCYKRAVAAPLGAVQWIFSDGLATVSLFTEPYGEKPRQEWRSVAGLTQMLGRRVGSDWWVTAMGEVPAETLDAFVSSLERHR